MKKPEMYTAYLTTVDGLGTLHLTNDSKPNGDPIFSAIEFVYAEFLDNNPTLGKGMPLLSENGKTVTVSVRKQKFKERKLLWFTVLESVYLEHASNIVVKITVKGTFK